MGDLLIAPNPSKRCNASGDFSFNSRGHEPQYLVVFETDCTNYSTHGCSFCKHFGLDFSTKVIPGDDGGCLPIIWLSK